MTRFNRLGLRATPTAWNLFLKFNLNRITAHLAPSKQVPFLSMSLPFIYATASFTAGGPYTCNPWGHTPPFFTLVILTGSRPMQSHPPRAYRTWRNLGPFVLDEPFDFSAQWDPILGPPAAGEYVGLRIRHASHPHLPSPPVHRTLQVQPP